MLRNRRFSAAALLCGVVSLAAILVHSSNGDESKVANTRIYELRTYTALEGRLPALQARFRDHTLKLFEKHGMQNIMYWTPLDEKLASNTLIYVVSHASMDAAKKSWDAFRADPDWIKARDASEADGKIVAGVTSVYMKATDYSPLPKD